MFHEQNLNDCIRALRNGHIEIMHVGREIIVGFPAFSNYYPWKAGKYYLHLGEHKLLKSHADKKFLAPDNVQGIMIEITILKDKMYESP